MKCNAVILAAGFSSRMGEPKAFVRFNGKTFLHYLLETYSHFDADIYVVFNNKNYKLLTNYSELKKFNFTSVINNKPQLERFFSLKTAAKSIVNKEQYTFIQNVDSPFVKLQTLEQLWISRHEAEVIIPLYNNKGGHPVLISAQVIENLENFEVDDYNFKVFLKNFTQKHIETTDFEVIRNINSKKELKNIRF